MKVAVNTTYVDRFTGRAYILHEPSARKVCGVDNHQWGESDEPIRYCAEACTVCGTTRIPIDSE